MKTKPIKMLLVLVVTLLMSNLGSASTTHYEVWRNTVNSSGSAQRIASSVSGTSYDDTTVEAGQTYYYWIKVRTVQSVWAARFISYDLRYVTNWLVCPTSVKRGQNAEILTRTDFFGSPGSATVNWYLKEDDLVIDDTMATWSKAIDIPNITPLQVWNTNQVNLGNYESSATAEVYFQAVVPSSLGNVTVSTADIGVLNCSLQANWDSPPSGVSASQGAFSGRVQLNWNAATGNSDFSAVSSGYANNIVNVVTAASPSGKGLVIWVDGVSTTSSQTNQWSSGTPHSLQVSTSQTGSDGKLYTFSQWGDGSTATTRNFTPTSDAQYTAIFTTTSSEVVTLYANKDTHVLAEYPTSTAQGGGSPINVVTPDVTALGQQMALIGFNVSGIPQGSTINSAVLTLVAQFNNGSPLVEIAEPTGSWSETTSWNTRPGRSSTMLAIFAVNSTDVPISISSGLVSTVQKWVDTPSSNRGFYLYRDAGNYWASFYARESNYSPSRDPKLVVSYTLPVDTQGDNITDLRAKTSSGGSSISESAWQRDNDPYFYWSEPSSLSAIVGYSWALDSIPDNTVDITARNYQFSTGSLTDGSHTFYVKSRDAATNWGNYDSFVIYVDTQPPNNPTAINSSSHTVSVCSANPVVSVSWSGATDSRSGVSGYSYEWSQDSNTLPDTSAETSGTTATSSSLTPGNWYFHVRTVDTAGNWNSGASHAGPFCISAECTYALDVNSTNILAGAFSGSVGITAGSGCSWTATPNQTWIHTTSSGSGSGTVNFTVDTNSSASARSGTITVGEQVFTINQATSVPDYFTWFNGFEPWWGAVSDPSRNLLTADPNGLRGTVLQVWGDHGWASTFRKQLVPATKWIKVETYLMSSGGDSGPSITLRESFNGGNAVDIVRFGFDDGVNAAISGVPALRNQWYHLRLLVNMEAGVWRGYLDNLLIVTGQVDTNRIVNWVCLDGGIGAPGYFDDVTISTNRTQYAVAVINPDHHRVLKAGLTYDGGDTDYFANYFSVACGSKADGSEWSVATNWTGVGIQKDFIGDLLQNAGYFVEYFEATNMPAISALDYSAIIIQDPLRDNLRPFPKSGETSIPNLLEYVTNNAFLGKVTNYVNSGGSVVLVGDAVRLLENGVGRLNFGKTVTANSIANVPSQSHVRLPNRWLFIRGNPFCGVDRAGAATYTVTSNSLLSAGVKLQDVALYNGNDLPFVQTWSDTVYVPQGGVSFMDVQVSGAGQYVLVGSSCSPPVYQDTVGAVMSSFMGYTMANGHPIYYIGSDSFFDYAMTNHEGAWHAGQWVGINNSVSTAGKAALVNLVRLAATQRVPAKIDLSLSGANSVCSWPTNWDGFYLEFCTNLPPTTWISNPITPVVVNGKCTVTNPFTGGNRFYRLRHP